MGCWGDGGGIEVMKERLGMACAINDDGGAAGARRLRLRVLRTVKEEQKAKLRARIGAGGCWRDNAALRCIVASMVRALAMHGHGNLHVARGV